MVYKKLFKESKNKNKPTVECNCQLVFGIEYIRIYLSICLN
jgi:hypothetical protein